MKRRIKMGVIGLAWYGTDLGSAIETAEKVIAKIKTNRFDKSDLAQLDKALSEIKDAVADESQD
jgi:hypothetical protein